MKKLLRHLEWHHLYIAITILLILLGSVPTVLAVRDTIDKKAFEQCLDRKGYTDQATCDCAHKVGREEWCY